MLSKKIYLAPVTIVGKPVSPDKQHFKGLTTLVTSCNCFVNNNDDDNTGRPNVETLKVVQKGGNIHLQFEDHSRCEEAFAFVRKTVGGAEEEESFASNFNLYSSKACDYEIKPGIGFSDKIVESNLRVGNQYKYCVSAVGKQYMASSSTEDGEFVTSSTPSCKDHRIHWVRKTDNF